MFLVVFILQRNKAERKICLLCMIAKEFCAMVLIQTFGCTNPVSMWQNSSQAASNNVNE
jgi:hypothetical protein